MLKVRCTYLSGSRQAVNGLGSSRVQPRAILVVRHSRTVAGPMQVRYNYMIRVPSTDGGDTRGSEHTVVDGRC